MKTRRRGIFFGCCFSVVFSCLFFVLRFWLLAVWLLTVWLLGIWLLARLLCFLASCQLLVAFLALAFRTLRQVAFWLLQLFVGICGFRLLWWLWLSHPLLSQFLSGRWLFGLCALSLVLFAFMFMYVCIYVCNLFNSLQRLTHPFFHHRFFEHHGGAAAPPPQPPCCFLDCLHRLTCTPNSIITFANMGLPPPHPPPPRYFWILYRDWNAPLFESLFRPSWGLGCRSPQPPTPSPLLFGFFTEIDLHACSLLESSFFRLSWPPPHPPLLFNMHTYLPTTICW